MRPERERDLRMNLHLEVGAQVVGPPLAALLADAAGEGLRDHRPLPVAVPQHHLLENPASEHHGSCKRASSSTSSASASTTNTG